MRTNWRLVFLLFVVGLFAAAQFAKIALSLEALKTLYPGSPVAFAVSAQSVVGILFGVTAGVIVVRLRARRVLLLALFSGAALSALQALGPPFAVFILLRLVEGVAHLALVIAAPTLMTAVSLPRDIPVAMGIWGTFFGIGFAGSAAVIPLLPSPQMVFLAHGAGLFALGLLIWPRLPGTVPGVPQSEGLIARHLAIYRAPRRIAPALSFLWHAMTFMGLLTFLPRFLGFWAGPVLPLMALLGTFGAGFLARRFPPQGIAFFGYLSSILAMAALVAVPDLLKPAVSIALFILIGLVPGACFAAIPALNTTSDDQARANGVLAQMGNVGTFLSVPLFSATLWAGLGGPMVLAATLSLAGLITIRVIHRKIAQSA